MIRGNYDPVAAERKKELQKQGKKLQQQKAQQRKEKLSAIEPIKLLKQIANLNSLRRDGKLSDKSSKYLDSLESDLKFIEKNGLHKEKIESYTASQQRYEQEAVERKTRSLGAKSVYFDPEWNPSGKVPSVEKLVLPNITFPVNSTSKYYQAPELDVSIANIPLPEGEPPRFYKSRNTQTTFEGEAIERNIFEATTKFVPTNILKKKSIKPRVASVAGTTVHSNIINEKGLEDELENEYASEEEEYLIKMGKLPNKKRKVDVEEVEDEQF